MLQIRMAYVEMVPIEQVLQIRMARVQLPAIQVMMAVMQSNSHL